jgi:anti-sigma factor RsiW
MITERTTNSTHPPTSRAIKHPDIEVLSAYLDREIDLTEARSVESHLASCAGCRSRLAGLEDVVGNLGRLEREAPPPWLAQRVRHAVRSPRPGVWERVFRPLLQLPLRAPIGSTLSMATALAAVFLIAAASGERVATYPGPVAYPDPPIQTSIVVAGRTFLLRDDDVWVEKGLTGVLGLGPQPEARIATSSPTGRALLARYSDLGYLLSDGSRVVMRYQRETLELWSGL